MTKRANGEGYIGSKKGKDGRYRGSVTAPDGSRRWVSGRTRQEVRQRVAELQRQYGHALNFSGAMTFGEFMAQWMPVHAANVRRTTADRDERSWRLWLSRLADTPLHRLHYSHFDNLMAQMRAQGQSANSIRLVRAVARTALEQAVKSGLIANNPVKLSTAPPVPAPTHKYLLLDQVAALLRAAVPSTYMPGLALIAFQGLRRGEALGLSISDVDLDARELHISHNLVRVRKLNGKGWELVRSEPKTVRSGRRMSIHPLLFEVLSAHLATRTLMAQTTGKPVPSGDDPLVCTGSGGWVDPDNFSNWLARTGKAAGLPGRIHPHMLRHSFATNALGDGVPIELISEALGHSNINVTLSTYAAILDPGRKIATDAVGKGIGEALSRGGGRLLPVVAELDAAVG